MSLSTCFSLYLLKAYVLCFLYFSRRKCQEKYEEKLFVLPKKLFLFLRYSNTSPLIFPRSVIAEYIEEAETNCLIFLEIKKV